MIFWYPMLMCSYGHLFSVVGHCWHYSLVVTSSLLLYNWPLGSLCPGIRRSSLKPELLSDVSPLNHRFQSPTISTKITAVSGFSLLIQFPSLLLSFLSDLGSSVLQTAEGLCWSPHHTDLMMSPPLQALLCHCGRHMYRCLIHRTGCNI